MDKTLRECPHCGKVVSGTANLIRHIKSCKPKFCAKCAENETCTIKAFFLECELAKK